MTDDIAMIQTVDFFTPIVDDPYMFGQIAAANSLSDVWAMGGEPAVALNIVGFPNCLDPAILGDILPARLLSALGVGLYGMFISVFVPEARKNRIVAALVAIGFAASYACEKIPGVRELSAGVRILLLTVLISLAAALLFPIREDAGKEESHDA